ncbi:MAG: hypothetical protein O7H41_08315 [Planctomycetota bacterium]|nr:hypothetical protein [Planctomycetota bacterium]
MSEDLQATNVAEENLHEIAAEGVVDNWLREGHLQMTYEYSPGYLSFSPSAYGYHPSKQQAQRIEYREHGSVWIDGEQIDFGRSLKLRELFMDLARTPPGKYFRPLDERNTWATVRARMSRLASLLSPKNVKVVPAPKKIGGWKLDPPAHKRP